MNLYLQEHILYLDLQWWQIGINTILQIYTESSVLLMAVKTTVITKTWLTFIPPGNLACGCDNLVPYSSL